MRSPCPGEPPRAALEGFSMHGPARRRPRKTPRDPRCFVCRCYVAHRMLPRPEPALIPRKRHPSARRAPGNGPRSNLPICSVCWSADQFSSRGVGSIATRIRSYMLASTLTRSLSWNRRIFPCHTKGPAVVSHGLAPASATPPGFAGSIVMVVTSRPRATGTSRVMTSPSKPRPART